MRIGIDFDNTLVNYNSIFNSMAENMGLKADDNSKKLVKNYFIHTKGDVRLWKEVQAAVYGNLIKDASFLPDFIEFYEYAKVQEIDLYIVSYKTEYAGQKEKKVSLHKAANSWLDNNLGSLEKDKVFFETAVTKKVKRIASLKLDYFIDDLVTVLFHKDFPKNVKKVLLSDNANVSSIKKKNLFVINNWKQLIDIIDRDKARKVTL